MNLFLSSLAIFPYHNYLYHHYHDNFLKFYPTSRIKKHFRKKITTNNYNVARTAHRYFIIDGRISLAGNRTKWTHGKARIRRWIENLPQSAVRWRKLKHVVRGDSEGRIAVIDEEDVDERAVAGSLRAHVRIRQQPSAAKDKKLLRVLVSEKQKQEMREKKRRYNIFIQQSEKERRAQLRDVSEE